MTTPKEEPPGAIPAPAPDLIELVEEFNGWWWLHREGSTNAAYLRVDAFTKAAREILEREAEREAASPALSVLTELIAKWRKKAADYPQTYVAGQLSTCADELEAALRSGRAAPPKGSTCSECGRPFLVSHPFDADGICPICGAVECDESSQTLPCVPDRAGRAAPPPRRAAQSNYCGAFEAGISFPKLRTGRTG
jgi:hypothetical protein